MAFDITNRMLSASRQIDIQPNMVLEVEGDDQLYSVREILTIAKYGEDDIEYGDLGLVYGGNVSAGNQLPYIGFSGTGTSTEIRQTLQIDKGLAESISNMSIGLIDKNEEITRLITPGNKFTDILGRRCKLWFGFGQTSFKDDYIVIFRGIVQSVDSQAGSVKLNLSHPDQKKRANVFNPASSSLSVAMGAGDTIANVSDASGFLSTVVGPDGVTTDPDFRTYIRINDEIMQYTSIVGNQFQGITRGEFGTTVTTHGLDDDVTSFYRIGSNTSNVIEIALKLMMSGEQGFQFTDIGFTNFVRIDPTTTVANSIYFSGVNVTQEYNFQIGDYIETTGASNGANNVTGVTISDIVQVSGGSYIVIDGVSFVEENTTAALLKVRSQYDVWPDGLQMKQDEVDFAEHDNARNTFLADFEVDYYLTEEVNGKEFLSEQVYNPAGCFALPRKSQASLGIHTPPLPNQDIVQLNVDNILNPSGLKLQRSTTKNITNVILVKHDESPLEPGRFLQNTINIDQAGIDQTGLRVTKVIESKGQRSTLGAQIQANAASSRRLRKYAKGAEFLMGVELKFGDGFNLEVGDKVLLDFSSLQLSDIQSGSRAGESRVMSIENKRMNIKNGNIKLDLVDDNFDKDARFGLIAPSSVIRSATGGTSFEIQESFGSRFGANEFNKWAGFIGATIRVVSPDYVTRDGTAVLSAVSGNTMNLASSLGFTPQPGDYMLYSKYSAQVLENQQLVYVHLSDAGNDFADGKPPYGIF